MFSTYLKACPRFERDNQTISSSPLPVSLREPDQVGISSHRASSPHGAKSIQHPNCRAKQMRPGSSLESSASFYQRALAFLGPGRVTVSPVDILQTPLSSLWVSDCIHTLSLPPWRNITLKSECPFCRSLIKSALPS